MTLPPLPDTYEPTRDTLQRVAIHIVARAVVHGGGRIDIRVAPGGFSTPEFGADGIRVRVSDGRVVRETANQEYESSLTGRGIDGSTLADLAATAQVDLTTDLYVGHDTPPVGDIDGVLVVDASAADALAAWHAANAAALARVAVDLPASATPTAVRLWPEHFDVAIDVEAAPGERVNLGGSPGDGFHGVPYAYVGPWTSSRPGDPAFWNAPFGAIVSYAEIAASADPVAALANFYADGLSRFG